MLILNNNEFFDECKIRLNEIYRFKKIGKDNKFFGAKLSAEIKSIKRDYIVKLIKFYMNDQDITPTAANNIIKNVLNRGVSNVYLLKIFGTTLRTASNKSDFFKKNTDEIENEIKFEMEKFIQRFNKILIEIKENHS